MDDSARGNFPTRHGAGCGLWPGTWPSVSGRGLMVIRAFVSGYSAASRVILQPNPAGGRFCPAKIEGNAVHRFLEASAGDYMTRTVKTVTRDTTMRELQRMFDEVDFNAFPVGENDDIVGLVT